MQLQFYFGVVLLELITGRKALDGTRPIGEVDLVSWALRLFKKKKKFRDMVDPALEGRYPSDGLYYALSICVDCLHEKADSRPVAANVVRALDILVSQNNDPQKDSHGAGPSGVKKGDEGEG
ncbi:hypothetical protein QVD17_34295 [Tagetes erecta]|uniref:Protein kinase domain-containing protein n=1 Tax=Tagetes erecta TaxID=13708 RepID=A0AAD8NL55_TARER|nr:hypothetical protein QVD17_34295 [Tagetes erecta]